MASDDHFGQADEPLSEAQIHRVLRRVNKAHENS
jgi:hypothetical protein